MGVFRTLFQYECKKILCRKITWIAFGLCVAMVILSLCMNLIGNYYVNGQVIDSNYHMYQTDQKYAEALNGRAIDQTLLEETIQAYRKIPSDAEIYVTTAEYQQYARPYSAIFNFIRQATPMRSEEIRFNWQPDEADFYAQRQLKLQALWDEASLSAGEIHYWQNEEAKIQTPFLFQRFDGYDILFSSLLSIGLSVLMFISICLPGLFPYEQTNKTDQIVMCCPLGKTRLYWAKIAAGASFAVGSTVMISVGIALVGRQIYKRYQISER